MPDENYVIIYHKTTSNQRVRGVDLVSVSVSAITVFEIGHFAHNRLVIKHSICPNYTYKPPMQSRILYIAF